MFLPSLPAKRFFGDQMSIFIDYSFCFPTGRPSITVEKQVLISLRYLGP